MPKHHQDPQTPYEWQEAVDMADVLLQVDAARAYGLVKGGPPVDVARCEQILADGRARGIHPSPDAVDRLLRAPA